MRRRKEKMGLRSRMLERKEDGSRVSGEKIIGTLKKRNKYSIQEEPTQQGWYVRVQQCWMSGMFGPNNPEGEEGGDSR